MGSERMRVLFVQPSVQPPGGGNGVAAWMLQALHEQHDVTLHLLEPFEPDAVNRFFGTRIDASRIRTRLALRGHYPTLRKLPLPLALLMCSLQMREVAALANDFDLLLTANNEVTFPRPGIQYVHFPTIVRPPPAAALRAHHHKALMRPYYAVCDRAAGFTRAGVARNLTLVNSDWTGRVMARCYPGIATETLYPPVAGEFPDVPWTEREPGFVCIGRIAPEKRLDRVIDILVAVRRAHPEVRLHLVGTGGQDAYATHIRARVAAEAAWVTLHEDIARADLVHLVTRQRFGLHGMDDEHFGMAVAELVAAGCIVWAPDDGGQVEVVGRDERLLYRTDAEAIAKITHVLEQPAVADAIRVQLAPLRVRFSAERFVDDFRALVARFVADPARTPAR